MKRSGPQCACGRGLKANGQGVCKRCHAEDMRERRRLARERGTVGSLAGLVVRRMPIVDLPPKERKPNDWARVPRGKSRAVAWQERPCSRRCGSLRDVPYSTYCSRCRAAYMRLTRPRYRDLPPDVKKRAGCRTHTRTLIERGSLVPQPCEVCGDPNVQPHHRNYDDPRDIQWLCEAHHHDEHRRLESSTARAKEEESA